MARARGGQAGRGAASGGTVAFGARPPHRNRATAIAILAALILLAMYTGVAAMRLREASGVAAAALLPPMTIAAILGLLLIVQGRQADAAARAFADYEEALPAGRRGGAVQHLGMGPALGRYLPLRRDRR